MDPPRRAHAEREGAHDEASDGNPCNRVVIRLHSAQAVCNEGAHEEALLGLQERSHREGAAILAVVERREDVGRRVHVEAHL